MADEFAKAPHPSLVDPAAAEEFTARKLWKAILLLAIGFVLAVVAIRLLVGNPLSLYIPDVSEKQYLDQHVGRDAVTAAFGSSMMHLGFDPRAFDGALAGQGISGRSLNMAASGAAQMEQLMLGRYWLANLPAGQQPCMLVLELNARAHFELFWMTHPREINEYDIELARLQWMFPPKEPWTRLYRMDIMGASAVSLASHYTNLGMLSNRIFRPQMYEDEYREETSDDRRGFFSMPQTPTSEAFVHNFFAKAPKHPRAIPGIFSAGDAYIVNKLHAVPNAHQARFVELQLPTLDDLYAYRVYPDAVQTDAGPVPIIDLGRPDLYPQFYRPELWHDNIHLEPAGASLVTQEFARQLAAWYQAHPPSSNPACGDR